MPRYIDADALTLKIDDWRVEGENLEETYGKNDDYVEALRDVLDIIEDAPTADVVERKKGKWIYRTEITCSVCGSPTTFDDNFCSHCGADMRGEEERR